MAFIEKGSCLCGEIEYKITGEPLFTHACHCTTCQKITGTSFWLSMFVLQSDFTLTKGAPSIVYPPQKNGIATKHYCAACGCNIYGTHTYLKNLILPATGTFHNQSWFRPQAHIFVRSKHPWVNLDATTPCFETFYDKQAVWPKKSLARLKAFDI